MREHVERETFAIYEGMIVVCCSMNFSLTVERYSPRKPVLSFALALRSQDPDGTRKQITHCRLPEKVSKRKNSRLTCALLPKEPPVPLGSFGNLRACKPQSKGHFIPFGSLQIGCRVFSRECFCWVRGKRDNDIVVVVRITVAIHFQASTDGALARTILSAQIQHVY